MQKIENVKEIARGDKVLVVTGKHAGAHGHVGPQSCLEEYGSADKRKRGYVDLLDERGERLRVCPKTADCLFFREDPAASLAERVRELEEENARLKGGSSD